MNNADVDKLAKEYVLMAKVLDADAYWEGLDCTIVEMKIGRHYFHIECSTSTGSYEYSCVMSNVLLDDFTIETHIGYHAEVFEAFLYEVAKCKNQYRGGPA